MDVLLRCVTRIAFGLARQGVFQMPSDANKETTLIDAVLDVSLRMAKERMAAVENEVQHTCEKGHFGKHDCKTDCAACRKGRRCAACAPCAAK